MSTDDKFGPREALKELTGMTDDELVADIKDFNENPERRRKLFDAINEAAQEDSLDFPANS